MRQTLAALLLLPCVSLATLAAEEQKKSDSMWDKAVKSDTGQGLKAQALSKVGADVTPAPAGAKVYFIEPRNGAEVKSPVKVVFGLSGMGVAPAGGQHQNTGHHHLVVDVETPPLTQPLPANNQVLHFGGGQTEAMVTLKPGKHTLQMVLGDWKHQPHHPPVLSEKITITVK